MLTMKEKIQRAQERAEFSKKTKRLEEKRMRDKKRKKITTANSL